MGAAGWKGATWTSDVYEREAPKPFELRAQFWLEGDPVELQTTLWLACDGVDRALDDLGEDEVVAWVSRESARGRRRDRRPRGRGGGGRADRPGRRGAARVRDGRRVHRRAGARSRDERGRGDGRAGRARGREAQAGGARAGAARARRLRRPARPLDRRRAAAAPGGLRASSSPWRQALKDSIRKVRDRAQAPAGGANPAPAGLLARPRPDRPHALPGRARRAPGRREVARQGRLAPGRARPGRRARAGAGARGEPDRDLQRRDDPGAPGAVRRPRPPAGPGRRDRRRLGGRAGGTEPAEVGAKIERHVRDEPLLLFVQLPPSLRA